VFITGFDGVDPNQTDDQKESEEHHDPHLEWFDCFVVGNASDVERKSMILNRK